tara:strand:- start:300 stop:1397 length:1098 start_codon:yes stop_codon:yes gene_type:complete
MAPIVYFLGGVLVRATTKAIRDRLIAQGFRKATKGQINSKIPTVTGTENNLISLITRAKNAIKSESPVASSGRNTARRKKPEEGNLIGNRGQSEFARKYGSRKMGGFGPVKSTRVKEARDLKLAQAKRAKAKAESSAKSSPLKLTNAQRVFRPSASASKLTGNKSSSTPTIVAIAPNASSADEASSKIPSVQTKARKTSTQVQRRARADAAAKRKAALKKPAKEGSLVGDAGTESKRQKARRIPELTAGQSAAKAMVDARYTDSGVPTLTDTQRRKLKKDLAEITRKKPVRPKLRPKVVEAEPMSLRSYLNAEIKSRKSTVTKEKTKAKKGNYKSIAEAKKAKSLYYTKGGKLMAAVYKKDLKGL